MTRSDVTTLREVLRGASRWRFGTGGGRERHRVFEAVECRYEIREAVARPEHVEAVGLSPEPNGTPDDVARVLLVRRHV